MGCGQTDQDREERREKQEIEAENIIKDFLGKYKHKRKMTEKTFHKKFERTVGYKTNFYGYYLYEKLFSQNAL